MNDWTDKAELSIRLPLAVIGRWLQYRAPIWLLVPAGFICAKLSGYLTNVLILLKPFASFSLHEIITSGPQFKMVIVLWLLVLPIVIVCVVYHFLAIAI